MAASVHIGYAYLTLLVFPITIAAVKNVVSADWIKLRTRLPVATYFYATMVDGEPAMIRSIHYSWLLSKQLEGLRKAGKKAELAAGKCEAILHDIGRYGCQCETVLSKRTRNGEARIKNCVKYDLGDEYEEQLMARLDESHLRSIFQGLFSSPLLTMETAGGSKVAKGLTARAYGTLRIR